MVSVRETPYLTSTEIAALEAFSKAFGRAWKNRIRELWDGANLRADTETHKLIGPHLATIRHLRNTHGPSWLNRCHAFAEAQAGARVLGFDIAPGMQDSDEYVVTGPAGFREFHATLAKAAEAIDNEYDRQSQRAG